MRVKLLSCVRLLATPWTAVNQAPPSMGFSRQEHWSGVPLPSPVESLVSCKNLLVNNVLTKETAKWEERLRSLATREVFPLGSGCLNLGYY